ncbi:helix-turn-helix domain-containing protein [Streptomyces longwoodensis]|uniref:helix-turn-helix domain-containing protein n=1 Tax=Streptomyces longwoodensis TaxID=68231 RepID=UPI0036F193F0
MATSQQYEWANGRQKPSAFYQRPKLTPQQRDEIRRRAANGESARDLAAEFGVSTRTIRANS